MTSVKRKLRSAGIRELSARSILKELSQLNAYLLYIDHISEHHKDILEDDEIRQSIGNCIKLKETLKKILVPLIRMQQ